VVVTFGDADSGIFDTRTDAHNQSV